MLCRQKLYQIGQEHPINPDPDLPLNYSCFCSLPNQSQYLIQSVERNDLAMTDCKDIGGQLIGLGCLTKHYVSDVFLLSIILFASTYVISVMLKDFKTSSFFPTKLRQIVSDFAVVIAIASMTLIDNWIDIKTPKLYVPDKFKVRLQSDQQIETNLFYF